MLNKYLDLFPSVKREDVVSTIKSFLKDTYDNNTIGARSINTLIHQYFIKGGQLEKKQIKEITFQKKLSFAD